MTTKTSSPTPHGPSGGSEKHHPDLEKQQDVTEPPLPSPNSGHENDDDDVRDTSNPQDQDLERTNTLGTVLSRLRSRRSAVIEPPPDGGLRAWMVVLSTHLVTMNTWGIINSFGVFQPYYMDLLDRPPEDISWIGSFEVFLLFFIGTFAGRLTDAGYFRPLYVVGVLLIALGMFSTSFCTSYWQFFLAQGICVGLGNGLLFCPCMAVTSTYFAKKRSLAFGLTAAGSATGGLIFPSMVRQLLPQVGFGWTIRATAFIQLGTLIIAGFFVKSRIPPRSTGPLVEWAAFKDLEYTFYAIGAFMAFWSTYFAFHYLPAFSRDILGMSYSSSLDLLLVLNGIGLPGRIIPAYIGDKVGPVNVYMSCTLLAGLIMYCWSAVDAVPGLYVWACFYGVAVGGVQSVFPAGLTSLTTDPQKQGTRMGMVFTIVSFATLTGSPIAGVIISSQGGKYIGAQVFSGTSMLVAMVFIGAARVVKTRKTGLGTFAMAKWQRWKGLNQVFASQNTMGDVKKADSFARSSFQKVAEVPRTDQRCHAAHTMPECLSRLSTDEYKKLGRKATIKMDLIILPTLMLMYILNYLDRNNIASAKLAGIMEDLDMNATEYQTCVSILFVGYILMQIPSNMMLGKIKLPGIYICSAMAVWGVISASQTVVKNFPGLAVCRFFIGFVEAVFFPGALFYLSLFYNRKQYAFRAALFYSGSQLGNAFGSPLAIPILELDGRFGLEGWRWLFLVEGVVTIGLAIIFAFILPNSLADIRSLNESEREWIRWNYEEDLGQQDDRAEITATQGFMLAIQDPKTWLMMATLYCIFVSAGVTNFFPPVVATLGYSRTVTFLLTAPPFVLCCCTIIINGFHSDKTGERYYHIICPLCITLVANVIAISTQNTGARYTAMMLMPASFYAGSTVLLSWITGTINQPVAKRATAIAIIIACCNTPNVWTPYLYNGAPRYFAAFTVNLVAAGAAIMFATITRLYLKKQNWKLDNGKPVGRSGPTEAQQASGFRYML
ncbi:hypothetical protein G7Z17_g4978 [Cylindrodendrum hubeiense]|uniref:Major facilitator superfamily (MFS) profile domain-containing protein n=1 Tax=Cylindrodendrum hubeiense TaxID=595255 RepID=A0A9P5LGL8_9HYPO|nr:hypothetical protein G7Z17_g4978 [Cylindrodendrum hubeiense]